MKKFLFVLLLFLTAISFTSAQDSPHFKQPFHYNIIKFNPTPMILWSARNVTLSYEHIWKSRPNQSIAFTLGYLELPSFLSENQLGQILAGNTEKYGINVSVDYRFYLAQRNARPAPDGIYISPFLSYYGYHFATDLRQVNANQDGVLEGTLQVVNLGCALGYQFVIAKRFTIDFLLLGPTFSYYSHNRSLNIELQESDRMAVEKEISNAIRNKFPIAAKLIGGGTLSDSYKENYFGFGFRYNVQLGFFF